MRVLSSPLFPPQPLYEGKPKGGPAVYFDEKSLNDIPGARTPDPWGSYPDGVRPEQGQVIGPTERPAKVATYGPLELYTARIRVRQNASLIALYDTTTNNHSWIGWVWGGLRWHFEEDGIIIGTNHVYHSAFKEMEGVVVFDAHRRILRKLAVGLFCVGSGNLGKSFPGECGIDSVSLQDGVLMVRGKDLQPLDIGWSELLAAVRPKSEEAAPLPAAPREESPPTEDAAPLAVGLESCGDKIHPRATGLARADFVFADKRPPGPGIEEILAREGDYIRQNFTPLAPVEIWPSFITQKELQKIARRYLEPDEREEAVEAFGEISHGNIPSNLFGGYLSSDRRVFVLYYETGIVGLVMVYNVG